MAAQEEAPFVPLVIGNTLNKLRDELDQKFVNLAENMEYQLTDLRQQLADEKALTAQLRESLAQSQAQCEEFKQEAMERTHDLNQINAFYTNNDDESSFKKLLDEVVERHQVLAQNLQNANYSEDVGPMSKAWQDEIYKIIQAIKGGGDASEQAALVDELQQRTKELESIKKILNGEEPLSKLEEIADSCEERHAAQQGDEMSTYDAPGKIEDPDAVKDNTEWEQLLHDIAKNPPKGSDEADARNDLMLQELGDRIADLQAVQDILNKQKDEEVPNEEVEEQAKNLLNAVAQRHNDTEDKVQGTINPNDAGDVAKLDAFKANDTNYRQELANFVGNMEEPEEQWWLDKDDDRRKHYDSIVVEQLQNETLSKDAVYLNRELGADDEKTSGDHTPLYIPIEPITRHRVIGTLYDAGEVCDYLATVNPDMIDVRCVHRPSNLEDPYPLTDKQVWENACLLLSSCKAMALQLPSYMAASWVDPNEHTPLLIAVLNGLHRERLKNYVSIEKHPEVIRLLTGNELSDDPEAVRNQIEPQEVLKRWINLTLGRPLDTDIGSIAVDLYQTLGKIAGDEFGGGNAPQINNNVMNKAAAECMLNYVENTLGIKHHLEVDDVVNGNPKLEELLAARVFDLKNGLSALSDDEEKKYRAFWSDDNHDDDAYLPWLNSQLPPHLKIGNLYRDLSDGIILAHILEKCKRECINWKKMRTQVRHKFDKVTNCNHVYDVMKNQFPFSLVGIGGNDIVDGKQKYVHTILWQIMRYQATKKLSELSFGGKEVTDADILNWSKETHSKVADRKTPTAKSFKDRVLTTALFYLELLKGIGHSDDVNDELVHWDVQPAANQKEVEEDLERRMANARYAISLVRMFGGDIFVLPEDLCIMEPKAVLSIYAALMTLDYEGKLQPTGNDAYKPGAGGADVMNKMEDAMYGQQGFSG